MASEQRICIFLTGGIGDFVASLPALEVIRRGFPRSKILLVGNPLWLPLLREGPLVDEVRSVDDLPLHAGFMGDLPKDHPLSRFLAGFDPVVSWFGDREGRWEKTLRGSCPGRFLVQPYHRVHDFRGHVSDYYLETLQGLGLPEEAVAGQAKDPARTPSEDLFPPALRNAGGLPEQAPFLCLHPGSGSVRKNWGREGFLEVARRAFDRWHLPSTVLLGPAEEEQRPFWKKAALPFITLREGLPLLETSRTLRRASVYVGNDSGITHLAAALGVPVVALFGPTDPARWAPRGRGVEIQVQPISPEQVLAALGRLRVHSSIIL